MWSYLQELNITEGVTVFFTTHYMEEAERVAGRIAIIDHGSIVALGTARDLMEKTGTKTLEDAFLGLTGKKIRDDEAGKNDNIRMARRVWTARK